MLPIQAIDAADDSGDAPRRMKRRDSRALAQFYDRYGRLVYALILRIVRDRAAAGDLVEETFLRVWNRAHSFEAHKSALVPWLLAVARNSGIDYLRSQEGRDNGLAAFGKTEEPRLYAGLEAGIPFAEQARRVKQALARLPETRRQAIELLCFDGLSQTEAAAKLGQPPDAVKAWVRDGLGGLRRAMVAGVSE